MKKEKKVLILRTCKEWLEKLVNWEVNSRYREAKPFWE